MDGPKGFSDFGQSNFGSKCNCDLPMEEAPFSQLELPDDMHAIEWKPRHIQVGRYSEDPEAGLGAGHGEPGKDINK